MANQDLTPGSVFNDKYRIERLLGAGGFARVFLATDEQLGRKVALKVLDPTGRSSVAPDDEKIQRFLKRFEREAKVISRLRAPEIVALYEFGRTGDGLAFMALEYVEGLNLWQVMTSEGKVSPERVESILRGVLRGLREAHGMGVHHRDLKPANIMIYDHQGERDLIKLLDFGVMKMTKDVGVSYSSLTTEGNVVGTPKYMAPEYITDNEVTPQTDLYSLGLVAYELLTGDAVVDGETAMEIMTAHITPSSAKLPADFPVSARLRTVINGLLAKDLDQRFKTAQEVLDLLDEDDSSIAQTMESAQFFEAAQEVELPEDIDELFERPEPIPNPRSKTGRKPGRKPQKGGPLDGPLELDESVLARRAAPPREPEPKRSGIDFKLLAIAVGIGAMIGAVSWWLLRV